jgi:hypothetical protein
VDKRGARDTTQEKAMTGPAVSPVPSVGELEWRECRDYKKLHLCTHEWDIYEAKYSDNVFVLQWHGGWMADCATPEAAKSLANSLQRILSGAAE